MIEDTIKELTAAVNRLADIMGAGIAQPAAAAPAAPKETKKPKATYSAPVAETTTPVAPAEPEAVAAEPEAEAVAEPVAEQPAAEETPAVNPAEVRAQIRSIYQAKSGATLGDDLAAYKLKVGAIFKAAGGTGLPTVPEDKLSEVLTAIQAL